ncbi:MAG: PD40 domain-containing protein, partial [Bacteroidales bacterium]
MKKILFILFLNSFLSGYSNTRPGYYRFPAIYKNTIVFTAEGDLWIVSVEGGIANRLTTHHGLESHPSISPDGTTVAFSAQYEGPTEVYTIPIDGGIPVRRTFGGVNTTVAGWTPDGKIIYSTRKYSSLPNNQLVTIDLQSGKEELIPLAQADEGTFSSTGEILFFTRLPFQGSYTKRYKGGTVQNLWKFTSGSEEAIPLTSDYPGTSKAPMYYNGRIYFLTDRDGTMNIWSMDEDGSDLVQHTFHQGWDISNPELSDGIIVYQLVADIYIYDITASADKKIEIMLSSDFDQLREKWIKKPIDYLTSASISPKGDYVILTARGQVFCTPSEEGRLVRVTRKEGVRYRNARFLPDGKHIVVLSDETGEYEFWKFPSNGTGEGEIITSDGDVLRWQGIPSPDGKWLAYTDKNYRIWLLNLEKGAPYQFDESAVGNFSDLKWSPDSKWLAYVTAADNRYSQIKLFNVENHRTIFLTSDRIDSYDPAWSTDGKWLYFLSDRHFRNSVSSPWGPRQPEPYYENTTKVYMVGLIPGEKSPFKPADELFRDTDKNEVKKDTQSTDPDKKKGRDENTAEQKQTFPEVQISHEGIQHRVTEVPVPPGDYYNLSVTKDHLFWMGQDASRKRKLLSLKIDSKDPKSKTVIEDLRGYELSMDGKKMLIQKSSEIY